MRNLEALLEEAKWGKLTDEELSYVVKRIHQAKPGNDEDLYTLLFILGKAGMQYHAPREHRKLIESFLYYPTDPMISKIALQTLCCYWDLTEEYLDQLKMFIEHVEWDENEQVRLIAMSAAGEFCRGKLNKELLQLLIGVFENPNEDELLRGCAYEDLARAMGKKWNDFTSAEYVVSCLNEGSLDLAVIHKAKGMVK